jgi:hypothetical protein
VGASLERQRVTTKIKCLVLIPVGPRSTLACVQDTVDSVLHYTRPGESITLILDDSRSDTLSRGLARRDGLVLMKAASLSPQAGGDVNTFGQLFVKQMLALDEATRHYDWDCLLRLDDDALILGPSPYDDALDYFARNPGVGMLGAYKRRGDGSNKEAAMALKGKLLLKQVFSRSSLSKRGRSFYLLSLIAKAKYHGYRLGDMCTGGALFISRQAYDRGVRYSRGRYATFTDSFLDDDLLFSLHTAATGLKIADFSDREHPMAINWRGLPMPVEELIRRGKKIVHPVKNPEDPLHEINVRRFFRTIREAGAPVR